MNETENIRQYTTSLESHLLRLAEEEGLLGKQLLETEDLTELFSSVTKAYLVSLGWIAFVGMAMAALWDSDWEHYGAIKPETLYQQIRDARGWDELDEYVLEDVLGFGKESDKAKLYTAFLRRASEQSHSLLMREEAEPSSPLAFQLYTHTLYALYHLGIALALSLFGYKLQQSHPN